MGLQLSPKRQIERITVYPCRNSDNSLFYLLWHYPHMFIRISIREDRMLCGFCIFMQTKTHALHSRPDISFVGFIQTPPNKHRSPRRKITVGNSQTGLMEFPHRFQSKQISKLHDLGNLENCPGDPDQLIVNIEQYQQYLTASFQWEFTQFTFLCGVTQFTQFTQFTWFTQFTFLFRHGSLPQFIYFWGFAMGLLWSIDDMFNQGTKGDVVPDSSDR